MISTLNRPTAVVDEPRPDQSRPAEPLRLTRRGRWAVLVIVTLAASVMWALSTLGPVSAGTDAGEGGPAVSSTWVVQPGETLWVIAERVDPDTDPRETVARIVAMNDLPDSSVLIGQELQIPA